MKHLLAGLLLFSLSVDCPASTTSPLNLVTWDSTSTVFHQWMDIIGPFPAKTALEPKVISTTEEQDHFRKLVHYQVEPGIWTDAFLLVPKGLQTSAPAAIVFHATSSNHILQTVGLADKPTRHLALSLVRRGYITLTPRCFIYGSADLSATTVPAAPPRKFSDYEQAANDLLARKPEWSGMGKMLWDSMRAVDYLETLPQVDKNRIICVGHSLGAKQALYLAAFDTRVRGAISSEGGVGLKQSNWDAPWYLGKRMPDPAQHDHDELLMLTAPRAITIIGGGSADGEASRALIDIARSTYDLYGRPEALTLQVHAEGHEIPPAELDKALDSLEALSLPTTVLHPEVAVRPDGY